MGHGQTRAKSRALVDWVTSATRRRAAMLGRRDPQRCLFDADSLPHRVPPDSIYGRMAALGEQLFPDNDLKDLYDPDKGRPSLPPSIMSGALLLQFHDNVSDEEAAERILYDLRWKVALHLPLDYAGFDGSSLSRYRSRLVAGGQERYAFDRFVAVGRAAGFIPDKVMLLHDTTWTKGAGAVQPVLDGQSRGHLHLDPQRHSQAAQAIGLCG